jgi:hypothetical protein
VTIDHFRERPTRKTSPIIRRSNAEVREKMMRIIKRELSGKEGVGPGPNETCRKLFAKKSKMPATAQRNAQD